ncbi:hypothetical protein EYZ11_008992 [Aspergillus tanneri]|uniref:Uncharacterized protein n=1 Tax=Aspergillus tanneri TaxID=1220188 RepID=A0A4S3J9E1_9EURO|nr:hypothetical protein EYZ11_008992 [Aspergillus tanneri]
MAQFGWIQKESSKRKEKRKQR